MAWATWLGDIGGLLGGLAMLWSAYQQRQLNRHEKELRRK